LTGWNSLNFAKSQSNDCMNTPFRLLLYNHPLNNLLHFSAMIVADDRWIWRVLHKAHPPRAGAFVYTRDPEVLRLCFSRDSMRIFLSLKLPLPVILVFVLFFWCYVGKGWRKWLRRRPDSPGATSNTKRKRNASGQKRWHRNTILPSRKEKSKGGELGIRPTVHPHRIALNKKIAEVGLTHETCPLRQNHVIMWVVDLGRVRRALTTNPKYSPWR
jgi:hypothetical protein